MKIDEERHFLRKMYYHEYKLNLKDIYSHTFCQTFFLVFFLVKLITIFALPLYFFKNYT